MHSIRSRFFGLAFCVAIVAFIVFYATKSPYSLILSLFIAFLLAGYFSREISKEIRRSVHKFSEITLQKKDSVIKPSGIEELGVLESAVNILIDELRQAAEKPVRAIGKLKQLLNMIDEGLIIVSRDLVIKEINTKAKKLFAIENFDPSGEHIISVVRDQRIENIVEKLIHDYSEKEQNEKTVRIFFPTIKNLSLRISPLDSKDIAILIKDVTQSTKLDNLRRDFVSNASHELKTPVAGIKLIAETIESAPDDKVLVSKLLKRLDKEATNLGRLVTDLLNLSKLEELNTSFEDILLSQLIQSSTDTVTSKMEEKKIILNLDIPSDDIVISGDFAQLVMMLTNLLENAIAYSHDGGTIGLGVQIINKGIEITVKDNGIGIPSKHIDRIFERFYRVDKGRSRETGGTGLGLSIVKHVIENHGGKIQVDSVLGEGSTFTVWLPA